MIRKSDVQWWVLEAKEHPEAASRIVEELADRLAELDAENERLRDEVARLQRRAPAPADGARVRALRRRVATLQRLLEDEAPTEPALVLLSGRLQAARLPLSRGERLARDGRPLLSRRALLGLRCLLLARPRDQVLLLTGQGRGFRLLLPDVPTLVERGNWPAVEEQDPDRDPGLSLEEGERLTAAAAVGEPPRFWTLVTRRGYVRQLLHIRLERRIAQGEPAIESPLHNDGPVALVDGDRGDLLLVTRWGKGVRFPHRAIPGQGAVGLELEPDDRVVAVLSLPSDAQTEVLVVTAAGYAMRRQAAQLQARSSPGGAGRTLIQAYDVVGAFPCRPRGEPQGRLLFLTYAGRLAFVPAEEVPLHTRAGKGTQVCDLGRDQAVAVAWVAAELGPR
jgi:DNA gyrase/topoisomerase IV subunit A